MGDDTHIFNQLQAAAPRLIADFGIASLALFGSAGRGELRAESDVDVLVTFQPGAHVTLFTLAAITSQLETLLNRKVDVVEDHPGLSPAFRSSIAQDLRRVA